MPRKTTRGGRQAVRQRRTVGRGPSTLDQAPAGVADVPQDSVIPSITATSPAALVAPASAPRPRPAVGSRPTASGSSLSTEQVRNEFRYIRGDLVRLLVTTVAVTLFMVIAHYIINVLN